MRLRFRRATRGLGNHVILVLFAAFAVGPLSVLLFNAFKPAVEIGSNPLGLPSQIELSNLSVAWDQGNFITTLPNTLQLVALTLLGVLPVAGLAAYSLSRLHIPGASLIMIYLLVTSTLPLQLFLVPLFYLWGQLGLINSLPGLAIIYIGVMSPFAVFLLRSYMVLIPKDFEDAARVDGAGELQLFRHIVAPLSWPGFLAAGLITALGVWQEYLMATVFLLKPESFTLVTSFQRFTNRYATDWSLESAAGLITILPVVIVFLALQRRFIAGMTRGGLAGY